MALLGVDRTFLSAKLAGQHQVPTHVFKEGGGKSAPNEVHRHQEKWQKNNPQSPDLMKQATLSFTFVLHVSVYIVFSLPLSHQTLG